VKKILRQSKQIQALETKCRILKQLVSLQNRSLQFVASNIGLYVGSTLQEIKGETIHQLCEDVELEVQESQPSYVGQDDDHRNHVLH